MIDEIDAVRELSSAKKEPNAERLAPVHARLLAAAQDEPEGRPAPGRMRSRAGMRRVATVTGLAAAAAAIATTGVVGVQVLTEPGAPGAPPAADAAEVLRLAAKAAATEPWTEPKGDQYLLVEQQLMINDQMLPKTERVERFVRKDYAISSDRSKPTASRWRTLRSSPGAPSADPDEYPKDRRSVAGPCQDGFSSLLGSRLSYSDLRRWPTKADALKPRLRKVGDGQVPGQYDRDDAIWWGITDVLESNAGAVPPKLMAGLFRVAADLPGVRVVDEVADVAGRRGVVVSRSQDHLHRIDLIFDADSHEYLGERDVATKNDTTLGTPKGVEGTTAVTKVSVADKLPGWAAEIKPERCP